MKRDSASNLLHKIRKSFCSNKTSTVAQVPIKITNSKKTKRIGLVVTGIKDLKKKAHSYLKFPVAHSENSLKVFLEDGTEVLNDDYLLTLHNHVVMVVPAEFSLENNTLEEAIKNYQEAVSQLKQYDALEILQFLEENSEDVLKHSMNYIATISNSKSHLSKKSEHPEWFQGLNTSYNSKEAYLRSCAQGRIKSYLADAKRRLAGNINGLAIINYFKSTLKYNGYFAHYFDRTASDRNRLCCPAGLFNCQGKYNRYECKENHQINPYDNSESRILFSTWNLDHVVERVKILSELNRLLNDSELQVEEEKYFNLLFTLKNLKLVHKNCHVISSHVNNHDLL